MQPQPQIPGPKLEPFSEAGVDIEFIQSIASGGHAHLWKVAINGQIYALKMFKFNQGLGLPLGTVRTPERLRQMEPFYCECRAYGRLKEVGQEDMAVKCHGYLTLTKGQEAELFRLGLNDWDRYEDYDGPILAVVKDYEPSDVFFTPRMVPRMIRDLKKYHRLGILVHDIKKWNYIDGRICDFSYSWTWPHFMMDEDSGVQTEPEIYDEAVRDFIQFDSMIDAWNEKHEKEGKKIWLRTLPNDNRLLQSLRGYKIDWVPIKWIPSDYDWVKAEEDRKRSSKELTAAVESANGSKATQAKACRAEAVRKRRRKADEQGERKAKRPKSNTGNEIDKRPPRGNTEKKGGVKKRTRKGGRGRKRAG